MIDFSSNPEFNSLPKILRFWVRGLGPVLMFTSVVVVLMSLYDKENGGNPAIVFIYGLAMFIAGYWYSTLFFPILRNPFR